MATPCSSWKNVKDAGWDWGYIKGLSMSWDGLMAHFCPSGSVHKAQSRSFRHVAMRRH